MRWYEHILFLLYFNWNFYRCNAMRENVTCGIDNSKASMVYEGEANVETYPWLGTLLYPLGEKRITAAVVLVTKQMVLGSAFEFDKLPKENVRSHSRVVIGTNCNAPSIRVRDYSFHPDYKRNTYSALVLVQLEVDEIHQELRPICPPPKYFSNAQFYAMTSPKDCKTGMIRIYKMKYIHPDRCKDFYRRAELDMDVFWPSHTACARAVTSQRCTWRSGTLLVVKQDGRWRLLGFGMYGPGCQSPARFLDYGMHQLWVRNSVARIGRTAVTRLSENHLLLRRSLSSVQRFGPCDREEMRYEMYTDEITIEGHSVASKATYNVSLYSDVEYSCVVLKARTEGTEEDAPNRTIPKQPRLILRRWCAGPPQICYGFQYTEIHFYVEIHFEFWTTFSIAAYGKPAKVLDPLKAMEYVNKYSQKIPILLYESVLEILKNTKGTPRDHTWFYDSDVNPSKGSSGWFDKLKKGVDNLLNKQKPPSSSS